MLLSVESVRALPALSSQTGTSTAPWWIRMGVAEAEEVLQEAAQFYRERAATYSDIENLELWTGDGERDALLQPFQRVSVNRDLFKMRERNIWQIAVTIKLDCLDLGGGSQRRERSQTILTNYPSNKVCKSTLPSVGFLLLWAIPFQIPQVRLRVRLKPF